jgi:GT2 family glycosyltransferase
MVKSVLTSVIIVNYNAGQLLTDCVRSVLESTMPVEIFVIDNASTDQSMWQLRQTVGYDKRLHLIENTKNLGFAAAANQVLPQTKGDFLVFLNPDCVIKTDTFARFQATLQTYPDVGMAGCLVRNLDGSEQAGCRRSVPSPWRSVVRVLHLDRLFPQHKKFQSFVLTKNPMPTEPIEIEGISGACMVVRRAALQEVGAMDESYFLHCEDLDWFMRFHASRWKILFIPTIEITHVKGACSHHQPVQVLWYKHRGMVKFYRKFFQKRYPLPLMWGVTIAVWARFIVLAMQTLLFRR